ncbi:acetylornithine deacetylase [soil metagenome]
MREAILTHLRALVAIDSQNPPRASGPIADHLVALLRPAFTVDVRDLGDGSISVLAQRGSPKILFNFHVDTVPCAPGWTRDPFSLAVDAENAYGLGACDTKGAAAAMLAVALSSDADAALLFTTDEEAGQGRCVKDFVARRPPFDVVVVAEPTSAKAVLAHRGVATGTMKFQCRAAHSSEGASASATHALARWVTTALAAAGAEARFNVGFVSGGVKPNVVAAEAEARFGVRPPSDQDPKLVLERLAALAPEAAFTHGFFGPPLREDPAARAFAEAYSIALGAAVDFWTEASLFAAGGYTSIVLGAGSIARAHGPDESAPLVDLDSLARVYARVLGGVK